MDICTAITRSHLAQARVLARSHREQHPDSRRTVFVIDDTKGRIDRRSEPFDVLSPKTAGIDDFEEMAGIYDAFSLVNACKAALLRRMLEDSEVVAYVDSDIEVFGSLSPVEDAASRHGLVLTPHHTEPIPADGLRPTQTDILVAGVYNGGFIAVGRNDDALKVIDWWAERLRRECVVDPARGLSFDQRWLDLMPARASGLKIERDPGYNVAHFNLHERKLTKDPEGFLVNGRRLRFFHFSGFSPERPDELSRYTNRVDLTDPILRELVDSYRAKLIANGWEETHDAAYGLSILPNGLQLDEDLRRRYREALERGEIKGSIFTRRGARRLRSLSRVGNGS
jgi:hypothetical protein